MKYSFIIIFLLFAFIDKAQQLQHLPDSASAATFINSIKKIDSTKRICLCCSTDTSKKPMIIIDGKIVEHERLRNLNPNDVASLIAISPLQAIKKYGVTATYGALVITMKKH